MPALAVDKDYLDAVIGHELGYGRGPKYDESPWDSYKTNDIKFVSESGQRQAYRPPVLPGDLSPHVWSFLRQTVTVTLSQGARETLLPADCAGVEGPVAFAGDNRGPYPLRLTGDVRGLWHSAPDTTGRPRDVTVEAARGPGQYDGGRYRLLAWPTADADYEFTVTYYVNPGAVTADRPFPWGGTQYAELFIASALAAAEFQKHSLRDERWQYFLERLKAEVGMDRRMKPAALGYNRDDSDGYGVPGFRRPFWGDFPIVTVNGVVPE